VNILLSIAQILTIITKIKDETIYSILVQDWFKTARVSLNLSFLWRHFG